MSNSPGFSNGVSQGCGLGFGCLSFIVGLFVFVFVILPQVGHSSYDHFFPPTPTPPPSAVSIAPSDTIPDSPLPDSSIGEEPVVSEPSGVISPDPREKPKFVQQPTPTPRKKTLPPFSAVVTRVPEGDVLTVSHRGKRTRLRLYGIDCPELEQPVGVQAKQYSERLLLGKKVKVYPIETDKYARVLSWVFLDGEGVNARLVTTGMAWWYPDLGSHEAKLKEYQARAEAAGRGLWSLSYRETPWDFRNRKRLAAQQGRKVEPLGIDSMRRIATGAPIKISSQITKSQIQRDAWQARRFFKTLGRRYPRNVRYIRSVKTRVDNVLEVIVYPTRWKEIDDQSREAVMYSYWQIWAGIRSPRDLDSSLISVENGRNMKLGGSRTGRGSSIWVNPNHPINARHTRRVDFPT